MSNDRYVRLFEQETTLIRSVEHLVHINTFFTIVPEYIYPMKERFSVCKCLSRPTCVEMFWTKQYCNNFDTKHLQIAYLTVEHAYYLSCVITTQGQVG